MSNLAQVAAFNARDLARRAPNGMGTLQHALANAWTPEVYAAQVRAARLAARTAIDRVMHRHRLDLIATFNPSGYTEIFVLAGAPLLALPGGCLSNARPLASRWLAAGWPTARSFPRPRRMNAATIRASGPNGVSRRGASLAARRRAPRRRQVWLTRNG